MNVHSESHNAATHGNIEYYLRLGIGILLGTISGILTLNLLLAFSNGSLANNAILICLALGLEGSKILTWRLGKGYRVIAIALIVISILASMGSGMLLVNANRTIVESNIAAKTIASNEYQNATTEIASIDNQISILVQRLGNLPSDYVTATSQINANIEKLRERKSQLSGILTSTKGNYDAQATTAASSIFSMFGNVVGAPSAIVELGLLLLISLLLELSIIALTKPLNYVGEKEPTKVGDYPTKFVEADFPPTKDGDYPTKVSGVVEIHPTKTEAVYTPKSEGLGVDYPIIQTPMAGNGGVLGQHGDKTSDIPYQTPSTQVDGGTEGKTNPAITPQMFLNAMMDVNIAPLLRGRDVTADRLGIPVHQAKYLVKQLLDSGKIRVVAKRLVQAGEAIANQTGGNHG